MKKYILIFTLTLTASLFAQSIQSFHSSLLKKRGTPAGGIPVIESFTSDSTLTDTLRLRKPANVAVGDGLLIIVMNDYGNASVEWDNVTYKPTGFDSILVAGNNVADAYIGAFFRVANGTETDTIQVRALHDTDDYIGWYIRLTDISSSNTIDARGAAVMTSATATSIDITGVTTVADNCLVFYCMAFDGGDHTAFTESGTGWSEVDECVANITANSIAGSFGTKEILTGSSASGTVNVLWTSALEDGASGFQFSIKGAE